MARFLRLRVRAGTGLFSVGMSPAQSYKAGGEIVIRYEHAAALLRDKGRRGFDITDDFDDASGQTEPGIELPG